MFYVISGTNRRPSQTARVAAIFERRFKNVGAECETLDMANLPADLFDSASYAQKPQAFVDNFANKVLQSEGLFFVVPEYNGSFPGVLKYFIDMLKFPESFERRPVAFVGLSAGMWGANRAIEHLEGVFRYRNAFIFNERLYLPQVHTQIDAQDKFVTPLVEQLADSMVKNFVTYARTLQKALPATL